MGSNFINDKWKKKLIEIDTDYGHHNPYILVDNIKDQLNKFYKNEKKYHIKHNIIQKTWMCDSLKDYIYFLEKELSNTIKKLKTAEGGFDIRNELFNKKID